MAKSGIAPTYNAPPSPAEEARHATEREAALQARAAAVLAALLGAAVYLLWRLL